MSEASASNPTLSLLHAYHCTWTDLSMCMELKKNNKKNKNNNIAIDFGSVAIYKLCSMCPSLILGTWKPQILGTWKPQIFIHSYRLWFHSEDQVSSSVPIWLESSHCTFSSTNLRNCSRLNVGTSSSCTHDDDVIVSCLGCKYNNNEYNNEYMIYLKWCMSEEVLTLSTDIDDEKYNIKHTSQHYIIKSSSTSHPPLLEPFNQ